MAVSGNALKQELKPTNIFRLIKYNHDFYKANPTYFRPDGLVVFVGPQGSGKTLSAVNYVYKLLELYPYALLVTNLELRDYPVDGKKVFYFENAEDLQKYSNGKNGVIFLIDEIQLYFNSLESKNINPEVMVQISQQRKQRKHIVCTSQVFGRMAKPLREQFDVVILCQKWPFGLQRNRLVDRDSIEGDNSTGTNLKGKVRKTFWYFKSPDMFGRYDTYKVIETGKFAYNEERKVDIYGNQLPDNSRSSS